MCIHLACQSTKHDSWRLALLVIRKTVVVTNNERCSPIKVLARLLLAVYNLKIATKPVE